MNPKELECSIKELLKGPLPAAELRAELERLALAERAFSGFTWLWGPELYRRDRIVFRPFILSRFSSYMILPKWKVEVIRWKGDAGRALEAWLGEVDRNDDIELFRRLYEWKLNDRHGWRARDKRSREVIDELQRRCGGDASPAGRQLTLRKFDLWFELDEAAACALYEKDARASAPFILRHLKSSWFGGEAKRALWRRLLDMADKEKDDDFRWKLYRVQIPLAAWKKDVLELCERIRDTAELNTELERRHPVGWGLNLAEPFLQLARQRGRDVFPYLMRHLRQVWGGWLGRGNYGKMVDLAAERGWWDRWAALLRTCAGQKEFNAVVRSLLGDSGLGGTTTTKRLLMLAGVSREWNWAGFGAASVHQLDEPVALALYERFPDLLRGPFKLHIQSTLWGPSYPKLLERFMKAGDEEMVDYLASRLATRCDRWGNAPKMLAEADKLANHYAALKQENEAGFPRRACRVLSQIPAYSIWNYHQLVRENRLARLLFERSAEAYLTDAACMADLVEGSEIHVMALAYRAMGLDDPRAREFAHANLPLLLGTLLRPLQRHTRTLAFEALSNAAAADADTARTILERARDALRLPDVRYPKEKLLGLIARILHRWPELREDSEKRVIFERPA